MSMTSIGRSGRARLRPSRQQQSARTEPRPPKNQAILCVLRSESSLAHRRAYFSFRSTNRSRIVEPALSSMGSLVAGSDAYPSLFTASGSMKSHMLG